MRAHDIPGTLLLVTHGERLRVLLVDDDPASLSSLQERLQAVDVDIVGSTNDGEHALDLARLLHPDVALIDWDMIHFGGALTARLMARYAPNVTPVLLLEKEDLEESTPEVFLEPHVPEKIGNLPFWAVMKHATGDAMKGKLETIRQLPSTPRSSRKLA